MDPNRLDPERVRAGFDRAAPGYDDAARLEAEIADRLMEHLAPVRLMPRRVLDLGAGTGRGADRLARAYPRARIVALDSTPGMIRRAAARRRLRPARRPAVRADAARLPFTGESLDLVYSNLALPWCNDLAGVFEECARVLAPGGLVAFSTYGPDTLLELRQSWSAADGHVHVHRFPDMHDVGDVFIASGFTDVVMDAERLTVTYNDLLTLLADIRAVGATNAAAGRPRGLSTPAQLERVQQAYEARRREGVLPATFEIVYGHGWKRPDRTVSVALRPRPR